MAKQRRKKLSDVDREIIRQFCTVGVSALYDEGMTAQQIVTFMLRVEVQEQIAVFMSDYNSQDALIALTRFSVMRNLSRMSLDAVDILKQSIDGPTYEYKINADGEEELVLSLANGKPRLASAEPTRKQIQAARDVLDRLGVVKPMKTEGMTHANVGGLLEDQQMPVEVLSDKTHVTEEQRALARERIRNVIQVLSGQDAVASAVRRVKSKVSKSKVKPKQIAPAKKKKKR